MLNCSKYFLKNFQTLSRHTREVRLVIWIQLAKFEEFEEIRKVGNIIKKQKAICNIDAVNPGYIHEKTA